MKSASQLDNLILDVVSCLKDPNGSSKSAITMYIEETHTTPPNFRRLLSSKLESLTTSGKLVKIRHNYMLNGKCKLLGVSPKSNAAEHEGLLKPSRKCNQKLTTLFPPMHEVGRLMLKSLCMVEERLHQNLLANANANTDLASMNPPMQRLEKRQYEIVSGKTVFSWSMAWERCLKPSK
ncbi:hypothetical protein SUGI_0613240 [Cryptomeria japonica]|nr:hypothetical protein SUGI_0613240 [Cryptomeria japonica]